MELTREQINEAKNFPTEKIKAKSKAIKDTLKGIENNKLEREVAKEGMPDNLKKEVGSKVTGPIATLKKKLKETVDDKKPTDDLKSNLASKKALERMEKEAQKIKEAATKLTKKVAEAGTKAKANKSRYDASQTKAKKGYEGKKEKEKKERSFAANKYAAESVSFKERVRKYLK